ncbi:antibacterial peptide protease [Scopulibacillus darangshiensis]|uniref:Antibacterial peptide protease n=1 Tax=Scopulibacillus darangshiensis TaxID=442528 RepID=A0A4R2P9R7_9BACL|nr:immune inhibitor A domain-containing protein [Scopulibacillus darangshiensis]TCP31682.1 antibacterial peptide protease [Scopulibacillus darangshiensis]
MKHWKSKLSVPLLSAGLVFSAVAPASAADNHSTVSAKEPTNVLANGKYQSGPFDPGMVNEDKLLKSLIKQGVIDKDSSKKTQQKQLATYINKRENKTKAEVDEKAETKAQLKLGIKPGKTEKAKKTAKDKSKKDPSFTKGNGHKYGHKNKLRSIRKDGWDGKVRNDKVLILKIDFPDYAHDSITKDETDMYYDNYTKEHFQNMIFGKNGYKGPNGNNLMSMKQFYDQQSGGSYTISGEVAGWYTAKHPAAYYGGNDPQSGSDRDARSLIKEALDDAAKDPNINLSDYDKYDRNDMDGDGVYNEPDGIIDHLMVIHSGVGEEAGGGKLGADAIWSHRWNLGNYYQIPGTSTDFPYTDKLLAFDYTIEPEDGAAGVFSHEYGHDLGLPDEYDTIYSANSVGEPIAYWSIMASGSWAGDVPGTEPSSFSPYDKEYLQSTMPEANWQKGIKVNVNDLSKKGQTVFLDESSVKGTNEDAVRVNLPEKKTEVNTPASGSKEFFSGSANDIDHSMSTTVDLTNASKAELTFKAWYQIEQDFDYAYVEVKDGDKWVPIHGNISTMTNPNDANLGHGITGSSDGWVDASFDLSAYAGKKIELRFRYIGDPGVALAGFYADDIKVTADGKNVLSDGAEGDSGFDLNGFTVSDGNKYSEQYYLVEWRGKDGADQGLQHIRRGNSLMTYNPGMVVWYVDNSYTDNWVGNHPGDGFLGVVDAHQQIAKWSDGSLASTRYQIEDAAFSLDKTNKEFLDYRDLLGLTLTKKKERPVPVFDDSRDYSDKGMIYAGRNIPEFGLKINVLAESKDKSVGAIQLSKK